MLNTGRASVDDAPDIALENQEGLLGCALLGAARDILDSGITANHFIDPRCRLAWDAVAKLSDAGHDINETAIWQEARSLQPMWLTTLADKGPIRTNWRYHAGKVRDVAARHQLWGLCTEAAELASVSAPPEEIISALETGLLKVAGSSSDVVDATKDGWREVCDTLARAGDKSIQGLMTGVGCIDKIYRGLKRGAMHTLAARPGAGKSAFAANLALKTAQEGGRVLVFSAEMPAREYQMRLVAIESGQDVQSYMENAWPKEATLIGASLQRCISLPITIVDSPSINSQQMKAYARKFAKDGVALIIVDYLQLYRSGKKTNGREEEVRHVSNAMKTMAMECDAPVFVLAQMNRGIEHREGEPKLSDLRESGSIEQDSDTVAFLWQGQEDLKYCIKKHRAGTTGNAVVNFTPYNQRFTGCSMEIGV